METLAWPNPRAWLKRVRLIYFRHLSSQLSRNYILIKLKGLLMTKLLNTTEQERSSWPDTVIVELPAPFEDDRGSIQPLVDVKMESCVMITSRSGTERANHYHQTDWHYCYVISGRIEYWHRPHGSDQIPEMVEVGAGQMFFTPPMVDHTMFFVEDTTFLTWGRNSREQRIYEADIRRIPSLIVR